jgi:hypothetical protein
MSKVTIALLLLLSAAIWDPQRTFKLLDSHVQTLGLNVQALGSKLKSALIQARPRWSK